MPRLVDIYHRNPDDPLYAPNQLETEDEIEIIIGMIKSIMLTTPGEVLGDPSYGVDLEGLVFDTNLNESALSQIISKQLFTYCTFMLDPKYKIDFTLGFFKGEGRDACLIEFAINKSPILGIQVI